MCVKETPRSEPNKPEVAGDIEVIVLWQASWALTREPIIHIRCIYTVSYNLCIPMCSYN